MNRLPVLLCLSIFLADSGFSQTPHNPTDSRLIALKNGNVGLSDIHDKKKKSYFEVQASAAPYLNWALASALSLETPLVVDTVGGWPTLTVGTHGYSVQFLIDARFITAKKSADGLTVEFYFNKGTYYLKLFELPVFDFEHLHEVMQMAAGNDAFISVSARTIKLAQWYKKKYYDPNAWEFIGADSLNLSYASFSDVVFLEPGLRSNKIPFKRTKYTRGDKRQNTYQVIGTDLEFSGLEKQRIRMLETEKRELGGRILCVTPLSNYCVHSGSSFSLSSRLSYTQIEVRRLLRLSVGTLPTQFNAPLVLSNGAIILPPIQGNSRQEILTSIQENLRNLLATNKLKSKIAIPVICDGRWVAFVLDLSGRNSLTYLNSSQTLDIDLFNDLLGSIGHLLGNNVLENSCVKIYHVAKDREPDFSGPLIIESILRELEVGGPSMPFVLCRRNLQDLRNAHSDLVRFFEGRPEMFTPRDHETSDFVGALPKVTHLIPSLLFEN